MHGAGPHDAAAPRPPDRQPSPYCLTHKVGEFKGTGGTLNLVMRGMRPGPPARCRLRGDAGARASGGSMSQGAGFYPEPFRPSSCRFRCAAAKDPFGRRITTISTSQRTRSSLRSCATFIAIRSTTPVKRGLVTKPEEWL
jgi:hypothetical protein